MHGSIIRQPQEAFAHDPRLRGYSIVYRAEEVNRCPGCGRTHWFVGRLSAECAFCETALPLAEAVRSGGGHRTIRHPLEAAA